MGTRGDRSDEGGHLVDDEVLAEEAMAYIIRNKGVFAADSWTGSSVANGTRTIEEINRWDASSTDKPSWVPEDVKALKGYKGAVKDPDNVVFFVGPPGAAHGAASNTWWGIKGGQVAAGLQA